MSRSFGWDLAAYGDSYSALCDGVVEKGCFTATILRCNTICWPRLKMHSSLEALVAIEKQVLDLCCSKVPFIVDVPIDLGSLVRMINRHCPATAQYYWQLVQRPIDYALGGLKPLADFIGFPVARIANILRKPDAASMVKLNETLFETYPAANLEVLRRTNDDVRRVYDKYRWLNGLKAKGLKKWPTWLHEAFHTLLGDKLKWTTEEKTSLYSQVEKALNEPVGDDFSRAVKTGLLSETITRSDKPPYKGGEAHFTKPDWIPKNGKKGADRCLAELMSALRFTAEIDACFDADEFDSVLCSVVGCFPANVMDEQELRDIVREKLSEDECGDGFEDDQLVPTGPHRLPRASRLAEGHPLCPSEEAIRRRECIVCVPEVTSPYPFSREETPTARDCGFTWRASSAIKHVRRDRKNVLHDETPKARRRWVLSDDSLPRIRHKENSDGRQLNRAVRAGRWLLRSHCHPSPRRERSE